ncbi:MAG: DUF4190 domain-containing protein [Lachnospiraceae bacterium]|nr:DUF4190 domain-containing protein [Lachnospiraceae bacterium]
MDNSNLNNNVNPDENAANNAQQTNQQQTNQQFNNAPNYGQQQNQYSGNTYYVPRNAPYVVPGKNKAVASLVLGILSIVFWWLGVTSILSIILSVVGLILAASAKKDGYNEGIRTAGFVTSLVGLIGGLLAFLACVACISILSYFESAPRFGRDINDFFSWLFF